MVLWCVSIALAYCVGIVSVARFVPLEPFGHLVAIGGFVITALVIWSLFGFRCPACGGRPRARGLALGSSETTYSSMVALLPRTCSSCGVQLEIRRGQT